MANLTETQANFKKALIIVFILSIMFYTGRFLIYRTIAFVKYLFPPQIPEPEAAYGPLPPLKMPSVALEGKPQYILDTQSGTLPGFPDRLDVYVVDQPRTNLLSEQSIKTLATDLKFGDNFVKNGVSKFRWTDGINDRTLTADIVTKNFQLTTGVEKLTTVVNQSLSIRNTDAEETVLNFITARNLMNPSDIKSIYTVTTPSMVVLGRLKESKIDPQRSKLMKVDVYRSIVIQPAAKDRPAIIAKILGPNPKSSLVNFFVTNAKEPFETPIINYTYWNTDYTKKSEYYLTPISSIWQLVTENKGVVSYVRTEGEDYYESFDSNIQIQRIEVKDIYMAYYESLEYQPYLQPIYVFEGTFITRPTQDSLPENGEIVIYYPAVRGDFVKGANSTTTSEDGSTTTTTN